MQLLGTCSSAAPESCCTGAAAAAAAAAAALSLADLVWSVAHWSRSRVNNQFLALPQRAPTYQFGTCEDRTIRVLSCNRRIERMIKYGHGDAEQPCASRQHLQRARRCCRRTGLKSQGAAGFGCDHADEALLTISIVGCV